jgi:hypothetical protein
MDSIKEIVSNLSADEQFEILECIEKNFFIPVIMGKEYLATLLRRTEITTDDLQLLQNNVVLNDDIIECAHEKIQELSGIDSSDDEYEEESDNNVDSLSDENK